MPTPTVRSACTPSAISSTSLPQKGREVVWLAARDDPVLDHHLTIDPLAAGVPDVGSDARERGQRQAAHDARFDEHPRRVADGRHRLAGLDEVAHEGDGDGRNVPG